MALELNGTTGVSLVQDGVVTAADLASTLDLSGKTVTLPAGTGGKVLQVVSTVKTDASSTTSTSFVTISGLSLSITPSSTSSKIYIMAMLHASSDENYDGGAAWRIYRDGSVISGALGNSEGSRTTATAQAVSRASWNSKTTSILYLDSPATTSATTYDFRIRGESGRGIVINKPYDNPDNSDRVRPICTITLMEIAG